MKAILNLTQSYELPCEISAVSEYEVTFKITKDLATADTLNAFIFMKARIYEFSDSISVALDRKQVLSINFID